MPKELKSIESNVAGVSVAPSASALTGAGAPAPELPPATANRFLNPNEAGRIKEEMKRQMEAHTGVADGKAPYSL